MNIKRENGGTEKEREQKEKAIETKIEKIICIEDEVCKTHKERDRK